MTPKTRFHLIPNAHLDPVWLWDLHDGLSEAISTCQTVVSLMEEFSKLTFIRGESLVYETVELYAPEVFRKIQKFVEEGRWDVVGGTYIQPDNNLASEATLIKQFAVGKRYFGERFGKVPKVAWSADSFGHPAGFPSILARSGMESFAFTRPQKEILPLESPAFWWEADDGSRVLAYRPEIGWYGTARDEMVDRLNAVAEWAANKPLRSVGVFLGLGNHGGGPTRRMIREVLAWRDAHPEHEVVFSSLHRLFEDLRQEEDELPTYKGELGFCLRGCYASAGRVKRAFRIAESGVQRAEKTLRLVSQPTDGLEPAWKSVLLNSFHDILPGSSIERALEQQIQDLGGAAALSRKLEFDGVLRLAARVDTSVNLPPDDAPTNASFVIVNPHEAPFDGFIELEANLDYRPIPHLIGKPEGLHLRVTDQAGQVLPSQKIACEHLFDLGNSWRGRVVLPMSMPAESWRVLQLGYIDQPDAVEEAAPQVSLETESEIRFRWNDGLTTPLRFVTVEDRFGSWGSMMEEAEALSLAQVRSEWQIERVQAIDEGPIRWTTSVRLRGGASRLDLLISSFAGSSEVLVDGRLLFVDEAARLQIGVEVGEKALFDSPGGSVWRGALGEVPGGRWVVGANGLGMASDWLSAFDQRGDVLWASVVRTAPYACDVPPASEVPRSDLGEHRFRLILTDRAEDVTARSLFLCQPVVVERVPSSAGE